MTKKISWNIKSKPKRIKYITIALLILLPLAVFFAGKTLEKSTMNDQVSGKTLTNSQNSNISQGSTDCFSITHPKEWQQYESICVNDIPAKMSISKKLPNGIAAITISMYELLNTNGNTFVYQYKSPTSQFENKPATIIADTYIDGNLAKVSENVTDFSKEDTGPGLNGYTKSIFIAKKERVFGIEININLNSRNANVEEAKQLILPEADKIISSITRVKKNQNYSIILK